MLPLAITWTVPMLVIASVVVVSVLAWIIKPLKRAFVLVPYLIREKHQFHRLLTAGWLHADVSHLLFNMLTLWFFADQVVKALGPIKFLFLYVTAVVVAYVPTTIRHSKNPKYGSLGASGAVAAVVFSAILLYPDMKLSLMFLPVFVPGYVYAVCYLAFSVFSAWRARNGINHDAHFAGALYGVLLTFAFAPERSLATVHRFF